MRDSVNVLGTRYKIVRKNYDDDKEFREEGLSGYCYKTLPVICIGNLNTFPDLCGECEEVLKTMENKVLRHEITHAFLQESGLDCSSSYCPAWATNEEMVDWIAIQGPKIYKAWEEAGALDQ